MLRHKFNYKFVNLDLNTATLTILNLNIDLGYTPPDPYPINLLPPKSLLPLTIHPPPLPLLPPSKPNLLTDPVELADLLEKEKPRKHKMRVYTCCLVRNC